MWRILRTKTEIPTADRALPGRPAPDFEIPVMHYVNGNRIQAPFPAGLEQAMFGLGWGIAGSGKHRAFTRRRSAMQRASRPTRHTRKSARAIPATTRW